MTRLTVTPASTEGEVDLALEIAIRAFEGASGMNDYSSYKTFLWREDPSFKAGNLMLARIRGGPPVGVVRIVPRTVYRADQAFSVAGISSVCLVPEKRGKGLSTQLMEQTLARCRERKFDFAFLFARRAADHYYTRFGFWGIGSYSRVSIALTDVGGRSNVALGDADEGQIRLYKQAYDKCYAAAFGRVERSAAYWRFLMRRLQYSAELRFSTLLEDEKLIGYVVWSDRGVHELAYVGDPQAKSIVALFAELLPGQKSGGSLTLDLPPQHLFIAAAYGLDITLSSRECTYGGHMACILRPGALLDRMAARAPGTAAALGHLADVDAISHRDTCRLLGAWSPSEPALPGEADLPCNIGVSDQF
jgi:GNAT superfamily N-acetyltransferase